MQVSYLYNKYKIMIEANRPYLCNCSSLEEQHQPKPDCAYDKAKLMLADVTS